MAEKKFPWGLVVAAGAVAAVGVVAYIKREEIKELVNKVIVKIEDEIIEEIVEEEGYCELDTDGDGEVDAVVIDTDGDGEADTIVASICDDADFEE